MADSEKPKASAAEMVREYREGGPRGPCPDCEELRSNVAELEAAVRACEDKCAEHKEHVRVHQKSEPWYDAKIKHTETQGRTYIGACCGT